MNIFEITTQQAAYVLVNEMNEMELRLEKAESIVQKLTDDYFSYDKKTENGQAAILWEYDRGRIYADIVSDYLCQIKQSLESLRRLASEGAEEVKPLRM